MIELTKSELKEFIEDKKNEINDILNTGIEDKKFHNIIKSRVGMGTFAYKKYQNDYTYNKYLEGWKKIFISQLGKNEGEKQFNLWKNYTNAIIEHIKGLQLNIRFYEGAYEHLNDGGIISIVD